MRIGVARGASRGTSGCAGVIGATFEAPHSHLQWVMRWQGSHAREFRAGERCIGPGLWIQEIELDGAAQSYQDERRVRSRQSCANSAALVVEFEYHYDMGDGWVHRCVIEMAPAPWPELELRTLACTAGENACPPEGVGGHGYAHFLECITDRSHPEYADTLRSEGIRRSIGSIGIGSRGGGLFARRPANAFGWFDTQ